MRSISGFDFILANADNHLELRCEEVDPDLPNEGVLPSEGVLPNPSCCTTEAIDDVRDISPLSCLTKDLSIAMVLEPAVRIIS